MNDIFHREDERLKTFTCWPLQWLDKKQLAMTGMFYTGECDRTKCYFCEVEIWNWEREDQPVAEHLHYSPNCSLLRRRSTNNVPINWDRLNENLPPASYDICGLSNRFEIRSNAFSEGTIPAASIPTLTNIKKRGNDITSGNNNPKCLRYMTEYPHTYYFIETSKNKKRIAELTNYFINFVKYFIVCQLLSLMLFILLFTLEYIMFTENKK